MKWASMLESEVSFSASEDRSGYGSGRHSQPDCPTLLRCVYSLLCLSLQHIIKATPFIIPRFILVTSSNFQKQAAFVLKNS